MEKGKTKKKGGGKKRTYSTLANTDPNTAPEGTSMISETLLKQFKSKKRDWVLLVDPLYFTGTCLSLMYLLFVHTQLSPFTCSSYFSNLEKRVISTPHGDVVLHFGKGFVFCQVKSIFFKVEEIIIFWKEARS